MSNLFQRALEVSILFTRKMFFFLLSAMYIITCLQQSDSDDNISEGEPMEEDNPFQNNTNNNGIVNSSQLGSLMSTEGGIGGRSNSEYTSNRTKCPICPKCKRKFSKTTLPLINSIFATVVLSSLYLERWCKQEVPYEQYEKHSMQCDFRQIICEGCRKQFLYKDFDKHRQSCE